MNEVSAVQPAFFEGQYLGADDLAMLVAYFRSSAARRGLTQMSWGIGAGLTLAATEIAAGEFQVALMPGVAIDGYGRLIVVTQPTEIPTEKMIGIASGAVKVWVRYDQQAIRSARPGYNTCSAEDEFRRIEESFEIEVGERGSVFDRQSGVTVAGAVVNDAREAAHTTDANAPLHCDGSVPYQEMPVDDDDALWLVPVGVVSWSSATSSFRELTDDQRLQDRMFRRDFGTIAEDILAANGLLRLRDRATPFDADIGVACAETAAKGTDFVVCEGAVRARELIWLEGSTRVTGDLRLFGSKVEFRDGEGRDYVTRDALGVTVEPIPPIFLERLDNGKSGEDLRLALGPGADGPTRFTIGPATVSGTTICDVELQAAPHFVVQSDGKVGVGTAQGPDSDLEAALTVRGVEGTTEITDPETGTTSDEPIWHLIHLEDAGGVPRWEIDLWTDGESLDLHRPGGPSGTLHLSAEDKIGIGTSLPEAKLDIADTPTGTSSPLGSNIWLRAGDGGDAGRFWVEYGAQNAPLMVLSDFDNPPRIQFQQTGASEDETAPTHLTWIGHLASTSEDFGIIGDGQIGLGTEAPFADVTIDGSLGFKTGSDPLVFMFESGTSNADRTVLAHSPGFPQWGLTYQDVGDRFLFRGSTSSEATLSLELSQRQVGIRTNTPRSPLEVHGTVRLGTDGDLFAPGALADMRIIAGHVRSNGTRERGQGFSSVRTGAGAYTVTFDDPFAAPPFVVVSSVGDVDNVVSLATFANATCTVRSWDASNVGDPEGADDSAFTFIAIGAR